LLPYGNRAALPRVGIDDVHDAVIAPRDPPALTAGAHVPHAGAAAAREGPRLHHPARREIDDRDAARPARLPADPRRTPVGDVEQGPIPAGIKSVSANAGLDEASLLE